MSEKESRRSTKISIPSRPQALPEIDLSPFRTTAQSMPTVDPSALSGSARNTGTSARPDVVPYIDLSALYHFTPPLLPAVDPSPLYELTRESVDYPASEDVQAAVPAVDPSALPTPRSIPTGNPGK